MKLSQVNYQTDKPQEVEIKDHLGQSFNPPAFISVYAFNSRLGKQVEIEAYRELAQLAKDGKLIEDELQNDIMCEALAKLTTGWTGIKDDNDKAIKFSKEKAKEIYKNYPYLFDLVNSFSGNLGNYRTLQNKN